MKKNELPPEVKPYLEAVKKRFEGANSFDVLIEEFATQKMMLEQLDRQVQAIKAQRLMRDMLLPQARMHYKGMQFAQVDAGMPLNPGHNFHQLEYLADGRAYRWTGPEPMFFFDCHVDRTIPLKFSLLLGLGGGSSPEKLRCFTDNMELPLVSAHVEYGLEYSAVLMPREIMGLTRIGFLVPKMFIPGSPERSQDSRKLGVVFLEFQVQPATEEEADVFLARCNELTLVQIATQQSDPAKEQLFITEK